MFFSFDLTVSCYPSTHKEKNPPFGIGNSRSHWNKLNLHPLMPGLRGLGDEQLKIHFLEH